MPMVVANRYARALADVVAATGEYRRVLADLDDFRMVYRESAELREICETPAVQMAAKMKVLGAIVSRMGAAPVTLNFLRVLLANYRLPLLEEALTAFRKIAYNRLGIAEIRITSAADLAPAEVELLRTRFQELTRKRAELEFRVNRQLIGGIVAQIGSTVFDGSVRGQLQRIREQLAER